MEDWADYKRIKIKSLETDPHAFGDSLGEEISRGDEEWKERVENMLFLKIDDNIIGMVGILYLGEDNYSHIAKLVGGYVLQEYRGNGFFLELIKQALGMIKKNKKIKKVKLLCNTKQKQALGIYSKLGFKRRGVLKKELRAGQRYYDEIIMEKIF